MVFILFDGISSLLCQRLISSRATHFHRSIIVHRNDLQDLWRSLLPVYGTGLVMPCCLVQKQYIGSHRIPCKCPFIKASYTMSKFFVSSTLECVGLPHSPFSLRITRWFRHDLIMNCFIVFPLTPHYTAFSLTHRYTPLYFHVFLRVRMKVKNSTRLGEYMHSKDFKLKHNTGIKNHRLQQCCTSRFRKGGTSTSFFDASALYFYRSYWMQFEFGTDYNMRWPSNEQGSIFPHKQFWYEFTDDELMTGQNVQRTNIPLISSTSRERYVELL